VSTQALHSVDVTNIAGFASGVWSNAVDRCPKHMAHGPCGGVRLDGDCEVPGFGSCTFLAATERDWPYRPIADGEARVERPHPVPHPRSEQPGNQLSEQPSEHLDNQAAAFMTAASTRPVVVVDLPAPAMSADGLRACADELAGRADACLIGDHGDARVQFPPSYRARLLADAGIPTWAGINCRDRNRVAIEGEIAACVDAGVVGLHCVTGDHPQTGHRADAMPVFDLDCVDVVELGRDRGVLCSVAHAPAAPPVEHRLARLLAKVEAGAEVVFIDHCGGAEPMAHAAGKLRGAGFRGLVLACVPVVTSRATAAVIESFAGDRLPLGYIEGILSAPDPVSAGIAAATELTELMLDIPGVDGVNLSGGAQPGHDLDAAREVAEIGRRVLGATPGARVW
jgi:methylenetetrahydrofolate reductase (NADPH)